MPVYFLPVTLAISASQSGKNQHHFADKCNDYKWLKKFLCRPNTAGRQAAFAVATENTKLRDINLFMSIKLFYT
jgi:hypothetical protein